MALVPYVIVGALAALVSISALGSRVILPRCTNGEIQLGFVGRVLIGASTAVMWDHSVEQAFLAGLVVTVVVALIRTVPTAPIMTGQPERLSSWDEMKRLEILRRKRNVLLQNAAYYGAGELPPHLQLMIEECNKEIAELEGELWI